jgi:LPS sulfotransferase NodH
MNSALDYLLQSENAGEIRTFLRGRGPRAHIVAPPRVREWVYADGTKTPNRHSASWSEGAPAAELSRGTDKLNYIVVAEDAEQEFAILQSLGQGAGRGYGLFSHIVPALLCSANGMAPGRDVDNLKRYAILCVPRSGSRFLSASLSNCGVGAPREHIREPLAKIIAAGKLGFPRAIEALEKFGQRNGIFGTKLISTFMVHASKRQFAELSSNIHWMRERGYQFVHLRRPLNDAVISSYIAFQMHKWHFFGKLDKNARERLDALVFEDGAAWDEFIRFRAEDVIVNAVCSAAGAVSISYNETELHADGVVAKICALIGTDPGSLKPGSAPVPIQTRNESPTYRAFETRLVELLDRRKADVEPATIKRLLEFGKLNEQAASEMAAKFG